MNYIANRSHLLWLGLLLTLGALTIQARFGAPPNWQQPVATASLSVRATQPVPQARAANGTSPVWATAPVQSGGPFNITQAVIAGGGERSTGGSNEITGTLGQGLTTQSSGGTYAIAGGFWPGAVPSQCPTISLMPATLPNGDPGVAYPNQVFTASGGSGPYSFSQTGTLPPGLTFTAATATLAGTPTTPGLFNLTVTATDANQCTGSQNYTITINCPTITLNPTSVPPGTVGVPYPATQLSGTGGTAPYIFQVTNGSVPQGMSLSSSGLLSGTPTAPLGVNLEVRATDVNGCTGTRVYNLQVSCPTLTLNPVTLPNGTVGVAYPTTQLTATGGNGPHTFQAVNGSVPPGLTLTAGGLLSGTPTQAFGVNLTIRASDANGCFVERTYNLQIVCPTITVNPATLPNGMMGQVYSQQLTQSGGNSSITFSVSTGTPPTGLTLSASGLLSGTPTANGSFNFTVTATDANNCTGFRAYTLVIGDCPAITVNPATLPNGFMGLAYSQALTATGGTGAVTFAVTGGALPNGITLAAGGTLSGTPVAAGSFNFTATATDASNCTGTRAYTLEIINCSAITVNPATLPNGFVGTAYNQTFTATGGTGPYTFSVSAGNPPPGLNLNTGTGAFTGTPNTQATFNFTMRATDANGCTGTRSYTVIISGNGLQFFPLPAPVRLLDTRPGASPNACSQPNAPIVGGGTRTQTARSFCGIPANAQAITGNVTTVQSGGGFLTLFPSDAAQPTVASTNYGVNEVINNVFTVGLGAGDGAFKIFALNTTDVVVDVTGYYAPPANGGLFFHPLPAPVRLLETRVGQSGCLTPGAPLAGNVDSTQQAISACTGIPAAARAIVGNATTVGPQGPGFLTIFPADAVRPLVASSNYNTNQVVNGPFAVGLAANGQFKIFTLATTDLVVDVLGYYSPEVNDANGPGLLLTPLQHPIRLLETRPGLPVGCFKPGVPLAGGVETTQTARGLCDGITIPANALGVVGNATIVSPAGAGFLTLWPSTAARPLVATSNYNMGDVGNRHFIVGLGLVDGAFKIYTHATSHLVIDLSGYFAP